MYTRKEREVQQTNSGSDDGNDNPAKENRKSQKAARPTVVLDARVHQGVLIIKTKFGDVVVPTDTPFAKPREDPQEQRVTDKKKELQQWLKQAKKEEANRKERERQEKQRCERIAAARQQYAQQHAQEFAELARVRRRIYRVNRGARLARRDKKEAEEDDAALLDTKRKYIEDRLKKLTNQDEAERRKTRYEKLEERTIKEIPLWEKEIQELRRKNGLEEREDRKTHSDETRAEDGDDVTTLSRRLREAQLDENRKIDEEIMRKQEVQRRLYQYYLKKEIEKEKEEKHNFTAQQLGERYDLTDDEEERRQREEPAAKENNEANRQTSRGRGKRADYERRRPAWEIPEEEYKRRVQATNEYFARTWRKTKPRRRDEEDNSQM